MKKFFVVALAAMGMVACVQNEVVETPKSAAISFENTFVENATRAEDPSFVPTADNLDGFKVWAFMNQPDGIVFEAEEVTRNGADWTYNNTQYWMPGEQTYYFAALAPMNSTNWVVNTTNANTYGLGVVTFENVNGGEDLIYAATTKTTPKTLAEIQTWQDAKVALQFNHLLSKVKFTFKNGFLTDNVKVVVRNVKMDVPSKATIDLAVENWWDGDDWKLGTGTTTLEFGNTEEIKIGATNGKEAAKERLTIPAGSDYKYNISFDIDVYMGEQLGMTVNKTSIIEGIALEMGKGYNFTAEINPDNLELKPIEFTVTEVKDWITIDTPDNQVAESELLAALQLGGVVELTQDLVLTAPLNINTNAVINMNGCTLTGTINVAKGASLTVNDGAIVNNDESTSGIVSNGNLTLNNVEITSARHALRIESGKVVIDGGVYKVAPLSAKTLHALNVGDSGTVAEVIVKAGTFIGPKGTIADSGAAVAVKAGSKVTIEGGDFSGGLLNTISNNGEMIISGGVFDQEPKAAWLASGYSVTTNDGKWVVGKSVTTVSELVEALNTEAEVNIDAPIDNGTNVTTIRDNDVVINMNDNEVIAGGKGTNNYAFNLYGSNVEVNDVNLNGAGFAVLDNSEVTVNSGTIAAKPGKSGRNMFYVVDNSTVTVNEGTYTFDRTSCYFVYVDAGSTCYINGGHYEKPLANSASKDSFVNNASTGKVIITGGTFNVDPTKWLADGYKAEKSGKIWTVSAE